MHQMYNINDYHIELNKLGKIIIYLRKSREDMIDGRYASDEETLARHESQLQQWAVNAIGHNIPDDCIYKEVGSGEKIKTRPVFQEVLKRLETDSDIDGVLVINCSRLSRGDLVDCGNLINILELTNTLVLTPQKVYNLKNRHDKRYFKDELLRGNDYLEQVKELLANGRHWSASLGKYVHSVAPFGYDRVSCKELRISDGRGYTLKPNPDAEYVVKMYEMYADGIGAHRIASHLRDISAPLINNKQWDHCKVAKVLSNVTYNGYVTYGKRKKVERIVDGEVVETRERNNDCPIYRGLHEAIISDELWQRVKSRAKIQIPATRNGFDTKNPLASLVKCGVCGKAMNRHVYTKTTTKRRHALDKGELQAFMNMYKKRLKLSNLEIARRLGIKKHYANEWFSNNPEKFYPAEHFVENWYRIKELLQIDSTEFDAAVTEFEEVKKPETLACSGFRCSNVSANLPVVESLLIDMIKTKFADYNYFIDNYAEEITKKVESSKKAAANIDKLIAQKEKQLKNARIAYEQEVDTLEEYIERKKELNAELKALAEKRNNLAETKEEEKTIVIKKAVPILKNVIDDYYTLSIDERNELLKTVIAEVSYLRTTRGDNGDSIELDVCWHI